MNKNRPSKAIIGSVWMASNDVQEFNDGIYHYNVYNEDMDYIGDVLVHHNIFDALNDRGYSFHSYGKLSEGVLEGHDYQEITNSIGVTNSNASFRLGPGEEYPLIDTLEKGVSVEIIAECDNEWFLVQHQKQLGFIQGEFLHETFKEDSKDSGHRSDYWVPINGTIGVHDRSFERKMSHRGHVDLPSGVVRSKNPQNKVFVKQ